MIVPIDHLNIPQLWTRSQLNKNCTGTGTLSDNSCCYAWWPSLSALGFHVLAIPPLNPYQAFSFDQVFLSYCELLRLFLEAVQFVFPFTYKFSFNEKHLCTFIVLPCIEIIQKAIKLWFWLCCTVFWIHIKISTFHAHVLEIKSKWHGSHVLCHLSPLTCHLSPVTCHMSLVTCHLSPVTCHCRFSHVTCQLLLITCHLSHITRLQLLWKSRRLGDASAWGLAIRAILERTSWTKSLCLSPLRIYTKRTDIKYQHTDIATNRLNLPRGRLSEKNAETYVSAVLSITIFPITIQMPKYTSNYISWIGNEG